MGYTQKTENHLFSKSKMDMLALKLIVESEMHPTKNPRFQLPANYSKYFRYVPKMIFIEDKWYLLVKSKEAAGLIGNRQFFYPSNGFIPSCSIFLRKDVTSTENSAALHFKSSNVPLKPNLISEVDKENWKRRGKKKKMYLVLKSFRLKDSGN